MTRKNICNALVALGLINGVGALLVYASGQAVYGVIVGTYAKNHRHLIEAGAIVEYPEAIASDSHNEWWLLHNLLPGLERNIYKPTAAVAVGFLFNAFMMFGLAYAARAKPSASPSRTEGAPDCSRG